tara:strand:- start:5795 stop:6310 length:516 start_codon:yes stop_codon:yes gene_type:complete
VKKIIAIIATITLTTICQASELTFSFDNPSFSGDGYSSHVLSIAQLEYNRKEAVKDAKVAAEKAAARAEANTTLAKFVTNVESRIYANLSKQMVDNMFGTNCTPSDDSIPDDEECPDKGSATLPDGSTVAWERDDTAVDETGASAPTITLTVTDATGTITTLVVPVGDFKF